LPTRVVLLTQWFDPEPTFKGLAFARELVRQGFEVEVVTGFPNYPGGRLYEGYRIRLIQREVIDGVQITRLPLYPSHDGSALRRVLNYASFSASSLLYGLFRLKRPDVIYAYHPPLTVGVTASLLRLIRRIPVVYDIQDMWPDTLRATGMLSNERALSLIGRLCAWVYRRVDRIVVLSPGFRRLLVQRGVPEEMIEVIYNWCDEGALAAGAEGVSQQAGLPGPDRFKVVFAGNMGPAQALDSVISAAGQLSDVAPEVCFVLVGSGISVDALKANVADTGLTNVVFVPRVPMAEVGAILRTADALLVHLKNDPLFAITIPSKTQAYMAMGKPLVMAVPGDAAELVQRAECGVTARAEDPGSLADAVLQLVNMPVNEREKLGENSKRYYLDELSIAVGVGRFADCFRSLAAGCRRC
jgi:glycosyltransferase involved in cell wall biosynthesis